MVGSPAAADANRGAAPREVLEIKELHNGRYLMAVYDDRGDVAALASGEADVVITGEAEQAFVLRAMEDMNLRLAYGGTVARPQVRELAPFLFQDFDLSGSQRVWRLVILCGSMLRLAQFLQYASGQRTRDR